MAAATVANQQKWLRTVYADYLRKQFTLKTLLLQIFQRENRTVTEAEGNKLHIEMHLNPGEGPMAVTNDEEPPGSVEDPEFNEFNYSQYKSTMQLSWELLKRAADGPPASAMNPKKFQQRGLIDVFRNDVSYDMYRDGTGLLATPTSVGAGGASVVVDDISGLRTNMQIGVLRKSDGSTIGGLTLSKITVDGPTKTITFVDGVLDGAGAVVAADPSLYGLYRWGKYSTAMKGLLAAISETNTYGVINRSSATYQNYRGHVLDFGVATPLTPELIEEALIRIRTNSEYTGSMVIVSPRVLSGLKSAARVDRRYTNTDEKFNLWANQVMMGSVPIVEDRQCPENMAFVLSPETWLLMQDGPGEWIGMGQGLGLPMFTKMSGQSRFSATWGYRAQLVCLVPAANAVIKNLEIPAGAAA